MHLVLNIENITAKRRYTQPNDHYAELEIDMLTGEIMVLRNDIQGLETGQTIQEWRQQFLGQEESIQFFECLSDLASEGAPASFFILDYRKELGLSKLLHSFYMKQPGIVHGFIVDPEAIQGKRKQSPAALNNDLISMVTRELRSPMRMILSTTSLIRMELKKDMVSYQKKLDHYLELIIHKCTEGLDYSSELLQISSTDHYIDADRERLNISAFIQDFIRTNHLQAYIKGIDIRFLDDTAGNIELEIFPDELTRVFSNLLSNALKFSETGTTITIGLCKANKKVEMYVKDEGIGMSNEMVNNLFNEVNRYRRVGLWGEKSHGLGMLIVNKLITNMGGKVKIKSKEGEGTKISLYFC